MGDSIADLSLGPEFLSFQEWDALLKLPARDRAVKLASVSNPLANVLFAGIDPIAIFGYAKFQGEWNFLYFWAQEFDQLARVDAPAAGEDLRGLIAFGLLLRKVCDDEYTLGQLRLIYASQIEESFRSTEDRSRHVYWCAFGDIKFAAVYHSNIANERFSAEAIGSCIKFHYDYFMLKSPFWRSLPASYLYQKARNSAADLARIMLEPKSFDPRPPSHPAGAFNWPWQRCMHYDLDLKKMRYRSIVTTSLNFDIRKSTMILEQLKESDRGLFPSFIKGIVDIAKDSIFKWGGFFDKDTGDGIVAHFCAFDMPESGDQDQSLRAFNAGLDILKRIAGPCEKMQPKLKMRVGGLGGAIGLHTSNAVWICENGQITALGDSVILASRLSNEADNYTIFTSNSEYFHLLEHLSEDQVNKFSKKEFSGKEYNPRAKLSGMAYNSVGE